MVFQSDLFRLNRSKILVCNLGFLLSHSLPLSLLFNHSLFLLQPSNLFLALRHFNLHLHFRFHLFLHHLGNLIVQFSLHLRIRADFLTQLLLATLSLLPRFLCLLSLLLGLGKLLLEELLLCSLLGV